MNSLLRKTLARPEISIVIRKILEHNFKNQKAIIKKYFSADQADNILDVGCGTGEFSVFFPEQNYTGIDLDPENIRYAKAHYRGNFLAADATRLPFTDGSFSKVLVVGVFHHLNEQDAGAALAEIRRVLKPTGNFLVMEDTVSNKYLTKLLHRVDQGKFIRTNQEWRQLFSRNWLIEKDFTFNNGVCYYSTFLLKPSL